MVALHTNAQENPTTHPMYVHEEIHVKENKEPEFVGGEKAMHRFIAENIAYPKTAIKK